MTFDHTAQQQRGTEAAATQPVVIDIGSHATKQVAIGGAISGVLGLIALVSAFTGAVEGGAGTAAVAGVIGGLFLLFALFVLFSWKTLSRPRRLVFDEQGIRSVDPSGRPWSVAWDELGAVAISRTKQRRVKLTDFIMRRILVRLDLFPRDPGFRDRHPEMEYLWELHRVRNGYRLPLGSAPQLIPSMDEALHRYRPGIYRGVVDEGFTVGIM